MSDAETAGSMDGKTCLVTGATAGIGLVTARELARAGARVLGVGRSPERCQAAERKIREAVPNAAIEYLLADLSSQADIRQLAENVRSSTNRLDVLVNNAGGIFLKRIETADGYEMTFALNHLAYFLLTNLLLDLLRSSAPARIVNVSSGAHRGCKLDFEDLNGQRSFSAARAYQRSKLANLLFTRELSRRLEGTGVTVNALHPGYVKTEIFRAEGPLGWLLRRFADIFAISPDEGARTSIYLATSPEVEGKTGGYYIRCRLAQPSPEANDLEAARRLWDLSAEMTGLAR
jgi:retinol dehydrogenase-12